MKVYSPNENFTGEVAGVGFANGVGEVDKDDSGKLDWFKRKGYGVGKRSEAKGTDTPLNLSAEPMNAGEPKEEETKDTGDLDALENRSVKDLKQIATQAGIESPPRKKADLIKAIRGTAGGA